MNSLFLYRVRQAWRVVRETQWRAPGPGSDLEFVDEAQYRQSARRVPSDYYKFGTRLQSEDVLEALARYGTAEQLGWPALRENFEESNNEGYPQSWDLRYVIAAALLHCAISFDEASFQSSARALRRALSHPDLGLALRTPSFRLSAFHIALLARDNELFAGLSKLLPIPEDVAWIERVDGLRRAALGGSGEGRHEAEDLGEAEDHGDAEEHAGVASATARTDSSAFRAWWQGFNEPFTDAGLEAWEFADTSEAVDPRVSLEFATPYERIFAPVVQGCAVPIERQPLVTVIVPSYNPDAGLINTIVSLKRQSWQNLEILIIDDASQRGHHFIEAAAAVDNRARVIRLDTNSGAYHVRNTGLMSAAGEFVTVLDADDQSHSRRIELQMIPLLDDDRLVATDSVAIRVFGDGSLLSFTATAISRNASSLLFRKQRVLDALGLYDRVYKAADTEYIRRMKRYFGEQAVKRVEKPLGLIQMTANSLSRNDFRFGWWSGNRVAYRHQYLTWHELALGKNGADFSVAPGGKRAYTAPRSFLKQAEHERLSLAVLGDFGKEREQAEGWTASLEALVGEHPETPLGLLHGLSPRTSEQDRQIVLSERLWRFVESGRATWISWAQHTEIGTLIVLDPELLVLLPRLSARGIRVRRVVVVVANALHDGVHPHALVGPDWLEARALREFGVSLEWLPATNAIGELLRQHSAHVLPAGSLRVVPQPLVDPALVQSRLRAESSTRLRVGVLQTENDYIDRTFRRLRRELRGHVELTHSGGNRFKNLLKQLPAMNRFFADHRLSYSARTAFCSRVDVLLCDPGDRRAPLTAHEVWQAVVNGVVVVVPQSYAAEYGDAVTTFAPGQLSSTVRRLIADEEYRHERLRVARWHLESVRQSSF